MSHLFLLGSHRPDSNSELLARRAAEQLPPGTEQRWLRLDDLPLRHFTDHRHSGSRHPDPEQDGPESVLLDATLAATDLVIVSPLYWYSVSANVKLYLDHWSGWMRLPGVDFRERMAGRTLWGVTAYAGSDPDDAGALIGTLRRCADYLRMDFGGVLLGSGNAPGAVLEDERALERAKTFFSDRPATVDRPTA